MKEQLEIRMQQRVKMLYRYTNAMERGDTDTIALVLEEAQHDNVLERMLLEVNEVYQIEDRTVAHADDVVVAQEMLLTTFAENTDNVDNAQYMSDIVGDESGDSEKGKVAGSIEPLPVYIPAQLTARRVAPRKWYRSRTSWLMGAVAAILIALLVIPSAGVLADQFLSLFRVQQFQPVTTVERPDQLVSDVAYLLRNFGNVQWNTTSNGQPLISQVTSNNVADVAKLVSFQPQLPTSLPDGVGHVTQFTVSGNLDVTFTFDQAKAQTYLHDTGQSDVAIPASLTGAKFHVTLSSGLAIVYYDQCQPPEQDGTQKCTSGKVNLAVGEIPSPVINAEGNASLADLRSFLLALPKLSPDLHNLIEHTDVNSGVIPVPIPTNVNAQQITVKGVHGLLLSYNKANLVVWQDHGMVYLITAYGTDNDHLVAAANSFR